MEIAVGTPVCWTPAAFTGFSENAAAIVGAETTVSGRIVYVNEAHRYYRAEARFPGGVIRECFKY